MLSRIERVWGKMIDTAFRRRWIALGALACLGAWRETLPEPWQAIFWWACWGIALCLFGYFIVLPRRDGDGDEPESVERAE